MEAAVATKFVKWEVPTLESLHECKVYRLRMKVNNGERQYLFQKCDTIARMAVWLLRHTEDIPCKPVRTMERIQGYGQDGTPQDIVRKNWQNCRTWQTTPKMTAAMNIRQTAQSIGLAVFAFLLRCFLWIVNILWYIIREIVCGVFRMVINVMVFIIFLIAIFGFFLWLLTLWINSQKHNIMKRYSKTAAQQCRFYEVDNIFEYMVETNSTRKRERTLSVFFWWNVLHNTTRRFYKRLSDPINERIWTGQRKRYPHGV